jgi:hypothetical protein
VKKYSLFLTIYQNNINGYNFFIIVTLQLISQKVYKCQKIGQYYKMSIYNNMIKIVESQVKNNCRPERFTRGYKIT